MRDGPVGTTLRGAEFEQPDGFRTEREESDIDILIEFKERGRSFDAYMDLKFFLEDLFRRRVDRDTVKPALAPYILRSVRYAPANKQERMICDAGRDTML
ncbi:nucleotidyltransferase family protein [Methanoculleus sediminis]|uniref:nucleotidyltransferase family protein n=1 Tax=Methanoculleus sediminis TaxID=1550566 RepID=UPI000AA593B3|nr:nucleotidyltransferase domain-containing protein [Methanoculleus sediminis]